MRANDRVVLVAAAHASSHATTTQLARLVTLLGDRGFTARVVLLRGGDELENLKCLAPVWVADGDDRIGAVRVLTGLGLGRAAMSFRAVRARLRLWSHYHHPWIICDPEAAWFLRLVDRCPPVVVVYLADPVLGPSELEQLDRADLAGADLWLVRTEQVEVAVLRAGLGAAVVRAGDLWMPRSTIALPHSAGPVDPVVLSTPSNSWENPSHTVEVLSMFQSKALKVPIVWLTDAGEDEWLARHDTKRVAGSDGPVTVLPRGEALRSIRPRMIIRTGYEPSDPDLVFASALAGIPTVGFEMPGWPSTPGLSVSPFSVDELVGRAAELLSDDSVGDLARRSATSIRDRVNPHLRLGPLYALLEPFERADEATR